MIIGSRGLRTGIAGSVIAALCVSVALAAQSPGIGVTSLVVKDVEGKTEAEVRRLALRDSVYRNEIVETGFESASELHFADDTRISVGPNSSIVLDEFVYDPDPGEGTFALKVTEGVFRFFSGNMASSNYRIETPTVTVGVRGTVLVLVTRADGAVAIIMESDDGVEVSGGGNTVLLETAGKATVAFADGSLTPPSAPPAWALWRVHELENTLAKAGQLPPPPPPQEEQQDEQQETQAASVTPPPADPPPPEPVDDEEPKRGLPRAELASGKSKPQHANQHAWEPEPPANKPFLLAGDGGESEGTSNPGASGGNNGNGGSRGKSDTAGSNGKGNGQDG